LRFSWDRGVTCLECGSNLRGMTLAQAITTCFQYPGVFRDFVGVR
jgi:hypothetical protein